MNAPAALTELTYRTYAWHRRHEPAIPVEFYRTLYGDSVDFMEARYQRDGVPPPVEVQV